MLTGVKEIEIGHFPIVFEVIDIQSHLFNFIVLLFWLVCECDPLCLSVSQSYSNIFMSMFLLVLALESLFHGLFFELGNSLGGTCGVCNGHPHQLLQAGMF